VSAMDNRDFFIKKDIFVTSIGYSIMIILYH